MNRLFRRLALAVALVMAFQVVELQPAAADSYSRERSGSSRWSPQTGYFQIYTFDNLSNDFVWEFGWGDALHYTELNGRHRAFELKASVNQNYADQYDGYYAHNFPSGSNAYRDTLASETGSTRNFGFGAGSANYFLTGPRYWADVGLRKTFLNPNYWEIDVGVRAATNESHDLLWCDSSPTFCVFPDYVNRLIRPRDLRVRQVDHLVRSWNQNYMYNQSFEQGTAGYNFGAGMSYFVWCTGAGFGTPCFLQYNKGSAPAANVWQDVNIPVAAGDHYTMETMVRCRTGSSCPLRLVYWGLGGGAPNENRVLYSSVPNDGNWHICRLDFEHGAGGAGFSYGHSFLRWELYNDSGGSMDVDYTTMALYVDRTDGTSGDRASPPPSGPGCQRSGQFDL